MTELPDSVVIREAKPEDCEQIFGLINALAEYEKLTHLVTGSSQLLEAHLFGSPRYAETIVAEVNDKLVGFALFFHNYSTFLTQPGIYLEDIFVLPDYREQGIGKDLLGRVAQIAVERHCGRLEWSVLDWNTPAIGFYQRMNASILEEWRVCRVIGDELIRLSKEN
jgi:GNAT superfamily N-acetyltransferase